MKFRSISGMFRAGVFSILRYSNTPMFVLITAFMVVGVLSHVCAGEESIEEIINAKPLPGGLLVDLNRELADELSKIADDVREERFGDAVEKLHLLIVSDGTSFYPSHVDGRRYVSSAEVAGRVLSLLPEPALAEYRKLHGTAARKSYARAAREMDERLLLQVAHDYLNTEHGEQALGLYAQLAFDRGAYLHAAHAWERVHSCRARRGISAPMLLAKAALAYGRANVDTGAAKLIDLLKRAYPGVRGTIAGRKVVLIDEVRRLSAVRKPAAGSAPTVREWRSMAGTACSVAAMPPCSFAPLSLWKQDEAVRRRNMSLALQGVAGGVAGLAAKGVSVAQADGRVRVTVGSGRQAEYGFDLSAMVYPAVAAGAIITRREHEVSAIDLETGSTVWRITDRPVYTGARGKTVNGYVPFAGDMGRYTVSLADGNVYTIAGLRRIDPETYRKFASSMEQDSSSLLALSAADGALRWEVGAGKGDDEVVRKAKFLTAPTYYNGRLFSLVKVWNRYHVFCLDPATGGVVWQSSVGPIPTHTGEQLSWQAAYTMELMTERASPVAARDGIIYLTTNSGLTAAFDAATGRPVWGYRYDSNVSGKAGAGVREVANLAFLISAARAPFPPQNAVIVAGGRVIALPCDSESLLALDGVTGELMWQIDRKGCRHLTAIDEDRVLLSDPGLRVIAVSDGSVLHESDEKVHDRPAVTHDSVIAGGIGRILALDLKSYETDVQPVGATDAVLGTMVSAGGKLVAANAAGVTAYLGFDDAWKLLTARLSDARDAHARRAIHVERGAVALRSGRYELATEELLRADALSKKDPAARNEIRRSLYRAFMALARAGGSGMAEHFREAAKYAASESERTGVLRERIAACERAGRWNDAAKWAQVLREKHGSSPLQLDGTGRAKGEWVTGATYGRLKILEIAAKHGTSASVSNLVAGLRTPKAAASAGAARTWGGGAVEHVFTSVEKTVALVRNFDGKAVTLGNLVFAETRAGAVCIDTWRGSYGESKLWELSLSELEEFPGRTGILTRDARRLVLLGPRELVIVDPGSGRVYERRVLAELGIRSWRHGIADGDRIVLADGGGNLTCLDATIGRRAWRRNIRGLAPWLMQAGTDVLMCGDDRGRGVLLLDTRTGGRLHRLGVHGLSRERAFLNLDGIGVWLKGNDLEVFDPRLGGAGVLKTIPLGAGNRRILHFGREVLVLGDSEARDMLLCGDVGSSRELSEIRLSAHGRRLDCLDVLLAEGMLCVLCGGPTGTGRESKAVHVVAFKLPECRELWRKRIVSDDGTYRVTKPQKYDRIVSLLLRPKDRTQPDRYVAIDLLDGTTCGYEGKSIGPNADGARHAAGWAGGPAVLNGRAVAETETGLVCLDGSH